MGCPVLQSSDHGGDASTWGWVTPSGPSMSGSGAGNTGLGAAQRRFGDLSWWHWGHLAQLPPPSSITALDFPWALCLSGSGLLYRRLQTWGIPAAHLFGGASPETQPPGGALGRAQPLALQSGSELQHNAALARHQRTLFPPSRLANRSQMRTQRNWECSETFWKRGTLGAWS